MSYLFRQTGTGVAAHDVSSINFVFDNPATAGDLLFIAAKAYHGGISVTNPVFNDISGWSRYGVASINTNIGTSIYWKIASGGEQTITIPLFTGTDDLLACGAAYYDSTSNHTLSNTTGSTSSWTTGNPGPGNLVLGVITGGASNLFIVNIIAGFGHVIGLDPRISLSNTSFSNVSSSMVAEGTVGWDHAASLSLQTRQENSNTFNAGTDHIGPPPFSLIDSDWSLESLVFLIAINASVSDSWDYIN